MDGGSVVGRLGAGVVGLVLGLTLIPDISNIARVGISNVVGHNLGAAIGKSHTVLAVGGVVVAGLVGSEVGARVVIVDSVGVVVDGRAIISGLRVVGGGVRGGVVPEGHTGEGEESDEGLEKR